MGVHHDRLPSVSFPAVNLVKHGTPRHRANQGYTFKEFIDANIGKHPIYVGGDPPFQEDGWEAYYELRSVGYLKQVFPRNHSQTPAEVQQYCFN